MAVAGYSSITGTAIRPQLSPAMTLEVPDGTAQICSNHVQLFCDCDGQSISVRISGVCVYVRTYVRVCGVCVCVCCLFVDLPDFAQHLRNMREYVQT